MYINDLGMRHDVNNQHAANVNTVNRIKGVNTKTSGVGQFPTALKSAVESRSVASGVDKEAALSIEEALARLKNDPEWEDVGTALSALYKNQQQMQVQMNLLSSGYSNSLAGWPAYSAYGLGTSAYSGAANLLGSSIFGDMLL